MAQIDYRFGAESTASEVLSNIDLSGRLIVLTGATAGIGVATARALTAAGADLVIGARSPEKLEALLGELEEIDCNGIPVRFSTRPDVFRQRRCVRRRGA